jgi:hypothetical protein
MCNVRHAWTTRHHHHPTYLRYISAHLALTCVGQQVRVKVAVEGVKSVLDAES